MKPLESARVLEHKGFEECSHGRAGKRQLLLMDVETLGELGLSPGAIKENITTEGLPVNGLPIGQFLRIGEAEVEITLPCAPCGLMNDIRPGLQDELLGKRGMLCRVVKPGLVRRGDAIELIEPAQTYHEGPTQ